MSWSRYPWQWRRDSWRVVVCVELPDDDAIRVNLCFKYHSHKLTLLLECHLKLVPVHCFVRIHVNAFEQKLELGNCLLVNSTLEPGGLSLVWVNNCALTVAHLWQLSLRGAGR